MFLPGPDRAWAALLHGFVRSTLPANLPGTVERMILGWPIASAVGMVLGAAIGNSPRPKSHLQLLLKFRRPLPGSLRSGASPYGPLRRTSSPGCGSGSR